MAGGLLRMAWRLDGIDIAHPYQYTPTPVDWDLVPDLELVSHKATEGTGYTDPAFIGAWSALRRKGTRYRAAYHWIRPDSDVIAQANHFIDVLQRAGGLIQGELVQLDVEITYRRFLGINIPMRPIIAPEIRAWTDRVNQWAGRPVVIRYQNKHDGTFYDPSLADVPLWQADYTSAPSVPGVAVRQWSSTQYIPGIANRLDVNQIEDRAQLDHLCGYGTQPVPAPTPTSGDDPMLVILAPEGRNARFFAILGKTSAGQWAAYDAEWIEDGNEMAPFAQLGTEMRTVPVSAFRNIHVNKVPANDGWTEADFRRVG
jgi:GH25 family lysozyme M1 (1,4-beta-N-acetylmuramidase)